MNPVQVGMIDAAERLSIPAYWGATARQDNVRIRIPTWSQDHVDPPAIIGKSAYRKRDTRLLRRVNQTAHCRRRDVPGYAFTRGSALGLMNWFGDPLWTNRRR